MPHRTALSPASPPSVGPTLASIDLGCLAHNLTEVRRRLRPDCEVIAVVKADAYGHGAVPVASCLQQLGVTRFAVATPAEGAALRDSGIRGSILVMGALFPDQIPEILAYRLTPIVHEAEIAQELATALRPSTSAYPVHVKIDTGMGRLGLLPDAVLDLLQSPVFKGSLRLEGLMTHLADADGPDPRYTERQLERFNNLLVRARASGLSIPVIHAANSAAILRYPHALFSAARPGIMLYGYHTTSLVTADLTPVLSLTTRIAQVRTMAGGEAISYNHSYLAPAGARIAVLPVGYADGYSRALSNRGHVLIHGRPAPIVGRVCMDMTMVDVTRIPEARRGDRVTLIGRDGDQSITARDLADWEGTIPYEVLCGIGARVRRVYEPPGPAHLPSP